MSSSSALSEGDRMIDLEFPTARSTIVAPGIGKTARNPLNSKMIESKLGLAERG